jgi:hypothetical protein
MWARAYFCATVGAVDEATIKAYTESQKWDEDDQCFKITAPAEPYAGSQPEPPSDGFSRPRATFSRIGFYRLSAGSRLKIPCDQISSNSWASLRIEVGRTAGIALSPRVHTR